MADARRQICPAGYQYKGPSQADEIARAMRKPTCDGAFLPQSAGCVSSGPDLVVGAVHVTGSRLDMLDFTVPYMAVDQLLVKRRLDISIATLLQERIDQVFTVFLPLSVDAWIVILLEILFFTLIILMIEAVVCRMCKCCLSLTPNDMVAPGFHGIVDSFYWGFSMAFDPGASGKFPTSQGGKVYTVAHAFFMTIIAASYTGTVGPAIMSTNAGAIRSFDTLKSGALSVAVVGPRWNSEDDPAPYLGTHVGTSIPNPSIIVSESKQFKMLQAEMKVNSDSKFSIITAETMHSFDLTGAPFNHTTERDPCSERSQEEGIRLGVYDMVRCKSTDGKNRPHATIQDAPQVVYELMKRYNDTGECHLVSKGGRFGASSYGIGFPKNTSLPHIFSRAIERVKFKGQVDMLLREARLYDMDNICTEPMDDAGCTESEPSFRNSHSIMCGARRCPWCAAMNDASSRLSMLASAALTRLPFPPFSLQSHCLYRCCRASSSSCFSGFLPDSWSVCSPLWSSKGYRVCCVAICGTESASSCLVAFVFAFD